MKDRLRGRFNVAVAEIDAQDSWQRSVIAAVTISSDRTHAEGLLQAVENDSARMLGSMLGSTGIAPPCRCAGLLLVLAESLKLVSRVQNLKSGQLSLVERFV